MRPLIGRIHDRVNPWLGSCGECFVICSGRLPSNGSCPKDRLKMYDRGVKAAPPHFRFMSYNPLPPDTVMCVFVVVCIVSQSCGSVERLLSFLFETNTYYLMLRRGRRRVVCQHLTRSAQIHTTSCDSVSLSQCMRLGRPVMRDDAKGYKAGAVADRELTRGRPTMTGFPSLFW